MRIDVHAHYWTEDYLDLLVGLGKADAGAARGLGAGGGAELDARLRLMDRAGVQMQVLSACPQLPYSENREKAARAARFVNDQYAGLVQAHPDRFRAFAALPMPHLDASISELRWALDELGMAGVAMNTTVGGRALVEPGYEPVFAELNSARSTHSASAGSSSEPTSPTKTGTPLSARSITSTTPRSTPAPPGPSSATMQAPCSAPDRDAARAGTAATAGRPYVLARSPDPGDEGFTYPHSTMASWTQPHPACDPDPRATPGATVLSAFPALVPQHHGADTALTDLLDRSALYGVLAEIEALGLDLVKIRQLTPRSKSPESGDSRSP